MWADFSFAEVGVDSVRILPSQDLHLEGVPVHCTVLEVSYSEYYDQIRKTRARAAIG
jgi:hypothetical protein